MNHPKYETVSVSSEMLEFKFTSIGPKGKIEKLVQFSRTGNPDIYNLVLGNWVDPGIIDDRTTNDNKDSQTILATVEASIYEFTAHYPDKLVFYRGSTLERTRYYRMALTHYHKDLKCDFEIFGVLAHGIGFFSEQFVAGKEYFGFLLKRKWQEGGTLQKPERDKTENLQYTTRIN
jgi:hypothetical protein